MLNIISKSITENGINGPQKVVSNLIKGLEIIGYPYCINKALNATSQLWIHDDIKALEKASDLKLKAIVGPNLYITPKNIPQYINLSNLIYIHPSKWVVDFWTHFGFNRCKLDSWPTGIDTEQFSERIKPADGIVLIYFKERYEKELDFIKNILDIKNIKYRVISYGSYTQNYYLKLLKNTNYIIWIGRQESQGIALQEALSMNVPILVWDITNMGHCKFNNNTKPIFTNEELDYSNATAAYYFDSNCGIKIKDANELSSSIDKMEQKWKEFEPRYYIIKNLNLEKQARSFIELFNKHYNISYSDGEKEKLKINKNWGDNRFFIKILIKIKKIIKKIYHLLKI